MNEEESTAKGGVFARIGSFFSLRDDDEAYLEEEEAERPRRNVVPFGGQRRGSTEVSIFAPRSFTEVTAIADALRAKQVVIINLQGADRGLLQRVVDFTSGVAYTIEGRIQKLADAIYLVVPPNVPVNAQGIRESLLGENSFDFRDHRG